LNSILSVRETYKNEARQMVSIYSNQDSDLFTRLVNQKPPPA
jgi:hypothetical protein